MSTISGKRVRKRGKNRRSVALPSHASSIGGGPTTGGADDCGGIHGIGPVGERRHVEARKAVYRSVVSGVVAERAFEGQLFARVDVPLENEVGVGGYVEVYGLAPDGADRTLPKKPGEHPLVDAVGQRRRGRVRERRVASPRE